MIGMPWDRPELRGWSIVGMNHYHIPNEAGVREKRLFVAMTKDGRCVVAEGPDESLVFDEIARKAVR